MRMRIALSGIAVLAMLPAALPAGAQNFAAAQTQAPPQPYTPPGAPAMPFVYSSPIPPPMTSPVQPFTESPVGPYGRLTVANTPPAAPVLRSQSTPLVPNGVMLSNGAIVPANTQSSPALPPLNGGFVQEPTSLNPPASIVLEQAQTYFTPEANRNTRNRDRNDSDRNNNSNFGATSATPTPPATAPASALAPAPPMADTEANRRIRPIRRTAEGAEIPAGTSLSDVIQMLGTPIVTVSASDGQHLFFNDGVTVVIRDGIVQ